MKRKLPQDWPHANACLYALPYLLVAEEKARLHLDCFTIYDIITVKGSKGRLTAFQDICASPL